MHLNIALNFLMKEKIEILTFGTLGKHLNKSTANSAVSIGT